MTVNEVETRTGLERATVRFYEREKLISPARDENGYRNYSEADVEKLEKIKLLRALDFSVEDIRSMDSDASGFAGRLRARARSLEARSEDIEDARRVIARMLADGAEYTSLKSAVYLNELRSPAPSLPAPQNPEPVPEPKSVPEERLPVSPWRRYFARWMDYHICSLLLGWLLVEATGLPLAGGLGIRLVRYFLELMLILITEPLLLCTLGTTPGKLLLGLRVRDNDGQNLRWNAALERTGAVLFSGEGLYIPLVTVWRNWRSYSDLNAGVPLSWEYLGQVEAKRETDWRHYAGFIAAAAVYFYLATLIVSAPYLPENRGALTPEEYCENVNGSSGVYGWFLDPDGTWTRGGGNIVYADAPGEDWRPENVELTVENGVVTGVRHQTAGTGQFIFSFYDDLYSAKELVRRLTVALLGADRSEFPSYFPLASFQDELNSCLDAQEDFTLTRGRWTVNVTVSGQAPGGSDILPTRVLTLTVTR